MTLVLESDELCNRTRRYYIYVMLAHKSVVKKGGAGIILLEKKKKQEYKEETNAYKIIVGFESTPFFGHWSRTTQWSRLDLCTKTCIRVSRPFVFSLFLFIYIFFLYRGYCLWSVESLSHKFIDWRLKSRENRRVKISSNIKSIVW